MVVSIDAAMMILKKTRCTRNNSAAKNIGADQHGVANDKMKASVSDHRAARLPDIKLEAKSRLLGEESGDVTEPAGCDQRTDGSGASSNVLAEERPAAEHRARRLAPRPWPHRPDV